MSGKHIERGGTLWLRARAYLPGLTLIGALVLGCAGSSTSVRPRGLGGRTSPELGVLRDRVRSQDRRVAELEARLALLEGEFRARRALARAKLQETIVLGAGPAAFGDPQDEVAAQDVSTGDDADPPSDDRPPLHLRLHGTRDRSRGRRLADRGDPLPAVPVVHERLPVAPLPALPTALGQAAAGRGGAFRSRYLAALSALETRDYRTARAGFSALLSAFPSHRLRDKVWYWRGEAAYALRDYRAALSDFQMLAERFPQSSKRALGLYKASLCQRRLGREVAAQQLLARLRAEYPESEVVQVASRRGAR